MELTKILGLRCLVKRAPDLPSSRILYGTDIGVMTAVSTYIDIRIIKSVRKTFEKPLSLSEKPLSLSLYALCVCVCFHESKCTDCHVQSGISHSDVFSSQNL